MSYFFLTLMRFPVAFMETLIPVVGSSNPGTRGRNARGSTGNDPISNTIAMNIGAGLGAFATIIGVIPTPITFGIGRVLQIAGAAVTPGALGDGLKDSQ